MSRCARGATSTGLRAAGTSARAEAPANDLWGSALGLAKDVADVAQIRAGVQRIDEVSEEAFDAVLNTNLRGAMFLAQAAARQQVAAVRTSLRLPWYGWKGAAQRSR